MGGRVLTLGEEGVSKAEIVARELLERFRGGFVSRRDGHVVVKIEKDDKTIIVWVRQRPITRKALRLFEKIISKHEYDELVLLKLYREADHVKFSELRRFRVVENVDQI